MKRATKKPQEIFVTTKITRQNQTTVPSDVVKMLGVQEGDTLIWQVVDGVVTVRAV